VDLEAAEGQERLVSDKQDSVDLEGVGARAQIICIENEIGIIEHEPRSRLYSPRQFDRCQSFLRALLEEYMLQQRPKLNCCASILVLSVQYCSS